MSGVCKTERSGKIPAWPQWLLRPVKLQRLKDVLSLINQEHRLDVKSLATKAIRNDDYVSKRVDAPNPTKDSNDGIAKHSEQIRALVVDDNLVNQKVEFQILAEAGLRNSRG